MPDSFAASKRTTARKDHRCGECDRVIEPGEVYYRNAGFWEGDFWHMKTCQHCAAFRILVDVADEYYNESYYGGLGEWVANTGTCPGEVNSLRLYRYARWFQNRWRDGAGQLREVPV